MPNAFVYLQKDIVYSKKLNLEINDVGVVDANEWSNPKLEKCHVFLIPEWQQVILPKKDLHFFDVKNTGDAFQNKICNVCHKLLPTVRFAKNQNGINNRTIRRPTCEDCRIDLVGQNMTTAQKKLAQAKKPHLVPFECPICNKRTIAGVTSKVVLDHDHTTGAPRDWICDSCNTGIGRFKDSVELLQKAIEFIQRY